MTTTPMAAGTDPVADAAAYAMRGVHELRADNARLTELASQYEKSYCITMAELEMTKAALKSITADRNRIMRFNAELTTQLNNVHIILDQCFQRARDAEHLPDHPIPAEASEAADASEPIPEFLQKGPAVGGNGKVT